MWEKKQVNQESPLMHFNGSHSLASQINFIFAVVEGECKIQQQSDVFLSHYVISLVVMLCYSLDDKNCTSLNKNFFSLVITKRKDREAGK